MLRCGGELGLGLGLGLTSWRGVERKRNSKNSARGPRISRLALEKGVGIL